MTRYVSAGERVQRARVQPFHQWTTPEGSPWAAFFRQPEGYLVRFHGLADFDISSNGLEVQAWRTPGTDIASTDALYQNQVLPLALSRQGKLVLHASAIAIAGQCVAFVGCSGLGKSTLAASFASSGSAFLTDDGLQLEYVAGQWTAKPNHSSIRLWPDSREALGKLANPIAPQAGYTPKVRLLAGDALTYCDQPMPLHSIMVLGSGRAESVDIRQLRAGAAVYELLRHSFLLDIEQEEMLALHFEGISHIANTAAHYHLDYPRRYDILPQVRESIFRHVARAALS